MTVDSVLLNIFNKFIAIQDSEYSMNLGIFNEVFRQIKQKMGECDPYFKEYATQVQVAGSVYDGIKVGKLDEFDVNIVVRLPINYEDSERGILMENYSPGFVTMRIGQAFDDLDKQPEWEKKHKVTRNWRDQEKYFLQSAFRFWMQKTIHRALNLLNHEVQVCGVAYSIRMKESGPAMTLLLRRESFVLDVDLVPVIRFAHGSSRTSRWPRGYRKPPASSSHYWYAVPKPNKSINNQKLKNRCWRLAFHDYERDLMTGCDNLKCTIRLMKKLRDRLGMTEIASYYIKTVFLWEIEAQNNKRHWQNGLAKLFEAMVQKLLEALEKKNIPYFWNKEYNLIGNMRSTVQGIYCKKLTDVLDKLQRKDEMGIAKCLLTEEELAKCYPNGRVLRPQVLITQPVPKASPSVPQTVPQDGPAPSRCVVA